MVRLKKRFISLLSVIALLFSSVAFSVYADDYQHYMHTVDDYLIGRGYTESELFYETIDNVDYIYTVEDEEASIINVHNQYRGEEKIVFTFPTTLGGYPVTTIGDEDKKIEVFWYINYGEEVEYDQSYYPDHDPAFKRYSHIVIPEGYKYIRSRALCCFYNNIVFYEFPKSLRSIDNEAFENFYTNIDIETGELYTILPECSIWSNSAVNFINPRIISSRSADVFCEYTFEWEWGYHDSDIYVPANVSYAAAKEIYYEWDAAIGDAGGWYEEGLDWIVHCAPDSPWLKVFEDMGGHEYANIVTDVTPAEYIEFPEENVNVHVGDVVDLEAKTYPSEAIWTACDYVSSDPSIVKVDEYSGRITALKEGSVTITATHCERGYVDTCTVNVTPEPVPGVNGVEPATDTPYVTYGNRDYKIEVTGSPSKIQVVRDNGGTTTIDRRRATVTSNGETETWLVNMRVEAGTHNIRAKYGTVWEPRLTEFTVTYDLPKARSFDLTYKNGVGTFEVVTDPQTIKIQFVLDNGCTLTYSQGHSYVGDDGLRHWIVNRRIPANTRYTLKTKYGYTWTLTDLTAIS